jgi:hypothetical protein
MNELLNASWGIEPGTVTHIDPPFVSRRETTTFLVSRRETTTFLVSRRQRFRALRK